MRFLADESVDGLIVVADRADRHNVRWMSGSIDEPVTRIVSIPKSSRAFLRLTAYGRVPELQGKAD